jgi:hypothetical protein
MTTEIPATPELERRAFDAMARVKQRRGIPLHRKLPEPRSRWDRPDCGRDGCTCTHGQWRERRDDLCDRGFVPDPSEPGRLRHCPRCLDHARRHAPSPETAQA